MGLFLTDYLVMPNIFLINRNILNKIAKFLICNNHYKK